MAARVLRALVRRAEGGDTQALEELLKLGDLLPAAIRDAGAGLHRFGYTYGELAQVAKISRQAARERFHDTPTTTDVSDVRASGVQDAHMGKRHHPSCAGGVRCLCPDSTRARLNLIRREDGALGQVMGMALMLAAVVWFPLLVLFRYAA